MKDIVDRITTLIGEDDADQLARWAYTFAKNHDGMTPDDKGWFDVCVTHMDGNIDNPEAYCARVRDHWKGSTYWRGKGKTEKEREASVKEHPNIKKGKREPAE